MENVLDGLHGFNGSGTFRTNAFIEIIAKQNKSLAFAIKTGKLDHPHSPEMNRQGSFFLKEQTISFVTSSSLKF